jgi:hypothetical protein
MERLVSLVRVLWRKAVEVVVLVCAPQSYQRFYYYCQSAGQCRRPVADLRRGEGARYAIIDVELVFC